MGQSPFWWTWLSLVLATLLFLIFRVKMTLDPAKQGATKSLTIFTVLASMMLSYYLGTLSGATNVKPLFPEKETIYKIVSQPFLAGTNICVVLQPTKLGITTMEWHLFGKPEIYTLANTLTNDPGTRVIGVANNEDVVHLETHPLQPTSN